MAQLYDAAGNPAFTDVVQQAQILGALAATNSIQLRGQATATVQVTGIGVLTLTFEGSTDGSNFDPVLATPIAGGAAVSTTTANGHWVNINTAGLFTFRVRVSAYTSGNATVSIVASQGSSTPSYTSTGSERIDVASVNGTALGTPTNFGTSPGAVVAESVNSSTFIGTTVAVAASAGVQKVGISGAAGTTLDAGTAGVLDENIKNINNVAVATSAAGVQKVGIAGGAAGAAIDGAIAAVPPANALQIGIKAATANPANATAGNQVAIMGDKAGRPVVTLGNVRELIGVQTTVITASTAETTIITAGAAGVFNDLSCIIVTTTDAAAAVITIKDATAGTTRLTFNYPNAALAPTDALVASFPIPISQATAANNWTATVSVNAGSVSISCVFVKNT